MNSYVQTPNGSSQPDAGGDAQPVPQGEPAKPESHWRFLLGLGAIVFLLGGGMVYRLFTEPLRKTTVKPLGPGLTLTTSNIALPGGDSTLITYVVRADRKRWQLHLEPAAPTVSEKAVVSDVMANYNQAHTEPAPVGINGGFFAYDGAAVGAVKIDDEWIRLPWKNRTAIGWKKSGEARIETLRGNATVRVDNENGLAVDSLNGRPSPATMTALTKWYGASYQLRAGENAVVVQKGIVTAKPVGGKVAVPANGFVLVGGAQKVSLLSNIAIGAHAALDIATEPANWKDYETILGAGPRLVRDNHIAVTQVEEEFRADVTQRGPRTAIGLDKDGNYIILVIDGWTFQFQGLTLDALASEIQTLGAVDAINLDGGSSTTLIADGQLINKPASQKPGSEVQVANAVLVVPKKP